MNKPIMQLIFTSKAAAGTLGAALKPTHTVDTSSSVGRGAAGTVHTAQTGSARHCLIEKGSLKKVNCLLNPMVGYSHMQPFHAPHW